MLINKNFRSSHLVCTKVKLRLRKQQPKEQRSIRTSYETKKLKDKNVLETFMITLQNRYQALEDESLDEEEDDEIEKDFHIIEEAYTKTAEEV